MWTLLSIYFVKVGIGRVCYVAPVQAYAMYNKNNTTSIFQSVFLYKPYLYWPLQGTFVFCSQGCQKWRHSFGNTACLSDQRIIGRLFVTLLLTTSKEMTFGKYKLVEIQILLFLVTETNCIDWYFRVKMCASVTSEYLYVVHHEMGHCQYYLAYNRHQPEIFQVSLFSGCGLFSGSWYISTNDVQSGANHGFHEAIGDTAALSVISPTHLEKLGILTRSVDDSVDRKSMLLLHLWAMIAHPIFVRKNDFKISSSGKDMNFLMQKALGKLAFFPFALTMAKWSWDVASGNISFEEMNAGWWRYR